MKNIKNNKYIRNNHENGFGKNISQIIQFLKEGASPEKKKILEEIRSRLESMSSSNIEYLANRGYLESLSKAELKVVFRSNEFIENIVDNAVNLSEIEKFDFIFFKFEFYDFLTHLCSKILTHKNLGQLKEKLVENELVPRIIFSYVDPYNFKRCCYEYFDVCRRIVKDNPDSAEVWKGLGNYLAKIGAYNQSLKAYDFATSLERQTIKYYTSK